jgi:hypothetical protein
MPAFGNLIVNDATSPTPVAHTFNPVRIDKDGIAKHADRSSGIPVGYPTLDLQLKEPVSGSPVYKAVVHIDVPTLAQTSPSTGSGIQPNPTKAYSHRAKLELWLPAVGTLQERKNILEYIENCLALTPIRQMIENLEAIY